MDLMPVSDQSEYEQHYGNQEQPGGFRGIHRMAMVPVLGFVVGMGRGHAGIVDGGRSWVLGLRCQLVQFFSGARPDPKTQRPAT
jgi:hypothetical protein